jgi:hypothetical protein
MIPFSGPATLATAADITAASRLIGCTPSVTTAVQDVETGGLGGFLRDGSGRPRILFEAEHFSALTKGAYDKSHANISSPVWEPALYRGGAAEYDRLAEAVALDRTAALLATSWGLFQILGSNFVAAGYRDVNGYVSAMAEGENYQLMAFARFVVNNGLAASLRAGDWNAFALHYNGASYRANGYATKLAAAFARATGGARAHPETLVIGDRGAAVTSLQTAVEHRLAINLVADGVFGPATEIAVRRFQRADGLDPDGVAGPLTLAALSLSPTSAGASS